MILSILIPPNFFEQTTPLIIHVSKNKIKLKKKYKFLQSIYFIYLKLDK